MRWWWLLLILILMRAGAEAAQSTSRRALQQPTAAMMADTVQAATNKAVANLYEQIAPLPLSAKETVGKYLKDNNLEDEFRGVLRRADQIGSPRWIDDYTCQVRLEIPVARVTYALKQFAASHPRTSPTPDQIDRISKSWPRQVIGAMGASTSPVQLSNLRPHEGAWRDVPEQVREAALEEARGNAVEQAMQSVDRVRLTADKNLGDAFMVPDVAKSVGDWLASRPVTEVDFDETSGGNRQKLVVKVTLGVEPLDYFEQVRSAVSAQQEILPPRSDDEWERVRQEFLAAFRPAVGRATAKSDATKNGEPRVKPFVPTQRVAPSWVNDDMSVEGTATASVSTAAAKLKARQQAEAKARDAIWNRIEGLPLDGNTTIGQAAKQDPRFQAALRRVIDRNRPSKVAYRSDGTVVVHFVQDLEEVWDEVRKF